MKKILILCNYTKGICGVWQRAQEEAIELEKLGNKVVIFSSNATKGSEKIAHPLGKIGKDILIVRFPYKKLGGESFMTWNLKKAALKFNPEIIICHSYRHIHCHKALKIAKKIHAKCFLVTHAPFIEDRLFIQKIIVKLYDFFIGRRTLNKFDKVIAITKWEVPYLLNLGVKKENIVYIPNGLPDEFFKTKPKKGKGILFLGRISPVKNIELLVKTCKELKIKPTIVGPKEEGYEINAKISPPVYDLKQKIKLIDQHDIFILPSFRESMPQVILEAMARGKIVISSNTKGAKEVIENIKNGFLFEVGDWVGLRDLIKYCINHRNRIKNMSKEARKTVEEKFKWANLVNKWKELLKK